MLATFMVPIWKHDTDNSGKSRRTSGGTVTPAAGWPCISIQVFQQGTSDSKSARPRRGLRDRGTRTRALTSARQHEDIRIDQDERLLRHGNLSSIGHAGDTPIQVVLDLGNRQTVVERFVAIALGILEHVQ